ncbi:MAG: hypothetical protein ACKOW3_08595, partial [Hyphomicrobium sp.]
MLAPVSFFRPTPTPLTDVLRRKDIELTSEVFPAASVWRTITSLRPLLAEKVSNQDKPPSVEYSTCAPSSVPTRSSVASLVTKSN